MFFIIFQNTLSSSSQHKFVGIIKKKQVVFFNIDLFRLMHIAPNYLIVIGCVTQKRYFFFISPLCSVGRGWLAQHGYGRQHQQHGDGVVLVGEDPPHQVNSSAGLVRGSDPLVIELPVQRDQDNCHSFSTHVTSSSLYHQESLIWMSPQQQCCSVQLWKLEQWAFDYLI